MTTRYAFRKWEIGCHSLSHLMILAATFMVSRSPLAKGLASRIDWQMSQPLSQVAVNINDRISHFLQVCGPFNSTTDGICSKQ